VATDGIEPTDAPRPGDPRSTGPRPPARSADLGWLALAIALVVVTAVQFVGLAVGLLRLQVQLSGGGIVVGFLITVGWLLVISWFVLGSWRRTIWGCPFDHTTSAPTLRRCERHATVPGPDRPPPP
jgi:hypothetical protein